MQQYFVNSAWRRKKVYILAQNQLYFNEQKYYTEGEKKILPWILNVGVISAYCSATGRCCNET